MHPAENMLALKYTCAALGFGIVACSASSPTVPPPSEDNSVKVPPFSETRDPPSQPTTDEDVPDENIANPPDVKTPPAEPECGKEKEPNNDVDKASVIDKCMTGELAGFQDTDYLKITAPQGVTDMVIDHSESKGKVSYTVTIPSNGGSNGNGGTNNFNMSFSDKAPKTKITPGQTYLFQLKWDGAGTPGSTNEVRPWSIRVSFE